MLCLITCALQIYIGVVRSWLKCASVSLYLHLTIAALMLAHASGHIQHWNYYVALSMRAKYAAMKAGIWANGFFTLPLPLAKEYCDKIEAAINAAEVLAAGGGYPPSLFTMSVVRDLIAGAPVVSAASSFSTTMSAAPEVGQALSPKVQLASFFAEFWNDGLVSLPSYKVREYCDSVDAAIQSAVALTAGGGSPTESTVQSVYLGGRCVLSQSNLARAESKP